MPLVHCYIIWPSELYYTMPKTISSEKLKLSKKVIFNLDIFEWTSTLVETHLSWKHAHNLHIILNLLTSERWTYFLTFILCWKSLIQFCMQLWNWSGSFFSKQRKLWLHKWLRSTLTRDLYTHHSKTSEKFQLILLLM